MIMNNKRAQSGLRYLNQRDYTCVRSVTRDLLAVYHDGSNDFSWICAFCDLFLPAVHFIDELKDSLSRPRVTHLWPMKEMKMSNISVLARILVKRKVIRKYDLLVKVFGIHHVIEWHCLRFLAGSSFCPSFPESASEQEVHRFESLLRELQYCLNLAESTSELEIAS